MFSNEHVYKDGDVSCHGFAAYDDSFQSKRPLVLVAHDWTGRNELAMTRAQDLASIGYVGFAIDMYGEGKNGQTNDEKMALMQPLMDDRALLARRINAALTAARTISVADRHRVAVMGYCFGGLCALDLARSGADITGAISFHGLLGAPAGLDNKATKVKILALHGWSDPMATPEQVNDFAEEMTNAKVDWQLHAYGNTLHAFTNPNANDVELGTVYNKTADDRSWLAALNFFAEIF